MCLFIYLCVIYFVVLFVSYAVFMVFYILFIPGPDVLAYAIIEEYRRDIEGRRHGSPPAGEL